MKFKALICTLNSKYIHASLAPWCLYTACKKELSDDIEVKVAEGTINAFDNGLYVQNQNWADANTSLENLLAIL